MMDTNDMQDLPPIAVHMGIAMDETERAERLSEGRCPECGEPLIHSDGCKHCPGCGWAACDN